MSNSKIKTLCDKIISARKDYYSGGGSSISDALYDSWCDELQLLDPKNPVLVGIGSEPVSDWEKYTHKVPMGSLNKSQTKSEFASWFYKYIGINDELFLTLKLDGLSLSLIYEDGVLKVAATRGSGVTGENIISNVIKMEGVPLRLPQKINATIRGEIVLKKDNHQKHFADYSNPRNAASGVSRRYDGSGAEHLTVLVYEMVSDDVELSSFKEMFDKLTSLGFIVPEYFVFKDLDSAWDEKQDWQSSKRSNYKIDLDGLVASNNSLTKWQHHGSLNDRPRASIAIKFDSVSKETVVVDIINQVGNSGRITPVAVFDPKVNIMGAEIEKASLHNYANIQTLGLDIGCTVLVSRNNDVIPFLKEVIKSTGTIYQEPTDCPNCSSILEKKGQYLQCNNINCSSRVEGKIKNWIKELNILEWGDTLIEKLVSSSKVNKISDLYCLKEVDLSSIERMGEKSAKKCLKLLHEKMEMSLDVFIGGFSIPTIGSSTIRLIMQNGYDNLQDFFDASENDFENIKGLGPVKAKSLYYGLEENEEEMNKLIELGIVIKQKSTGPLSSKSIAFTGAMINKRAILESWAIDNGAQIKSSVNKDLDFLVINDMNSTSSKVASAKKYNVKMISEDQFLKMIGKI